MLEVVRHELSHVATPGHGHDRTWIAYNIKVGGDGSRCDTSEVTKATMGHTVEVYCEAIANADQAEDEDMDKTGVAQNHVFWKRQKKPADDTLYGKRCRRCRAEEKPGHLFWRHVQLAQTVNIQ